MVGCRLAVLPTAVVAAVVADGLTRQETSVQLMTGGGHVKRADASCDDTSAALTHRPPIG
jgi:hypothetical protein